MPKITKKRSISLDFGRNITELLRSINTKDFDVDVDIRISTPGFGSKQQQLKATDINGYVLPDSNDDGDDDDDNGGTEGTSFNSTRFVTIINPSDNNFGPNENRDLVISLQAKYIPNPTKTGGNGGSSGNGGNAGGGGIIFEDDDGGYLS